MSKRGSSEGTIRKRADGRWEGRVLLGYRNGKPFRPSFYGKKAADVRDQLTKAKEQFKNGIEVGSDRQLVKDFLSGWLENTARPRLRPRTFTGYTQHIASHIVPAVGHLKLAELSPAHVQGLMKAKSTEGLSPRTVRYMRAVLRTALNDAVKWGIVARNVATLVELPRATRHAIRTLDADEARSFLSSAKKSRLGTIFSVALAVGLRLGEALALSWDDVDLDARTVRVRRALQRIEKTLQFVEPKSERSRRTVTLPEFAVTSLKRYRVAQKKEKLKAGSKWTASRLVFTSTIGTPLDERNVRREFDAILVAAKLPPMRIHDLRHTCASLMLAEAVHP
jgi:integrase